jgi:putative phosphoesterase
MLVAVVSDTHGNREGMDLLAVRLKAFKVNTVLHLGDDYKDVQALTGAGLEVLAVPGVFCPEYAGAEPPNRYVVKLAGVKMLLTHTPQRHRADRPGDLDPEAPPPGVKLVLYGHTHTPALKARQGVWWLNPGHLRAHPDKGHPASFALLRLSPKGVRVAIRRLEDGEVLLEREI